MSLTFAVIIVLILIYFRIYNAAIVTILLVTGYSVYLFMRLFYKESLSSTGKAVSVLVGIAAYIFLVHTFIEIFWYTF